MVVEQQSKIAKQEATIAELKSTVALQQTHFQSRLAKQEKQMAALASDLQKVSAQLDMRQPRPQVALSDQ